VGSQALVGRTELKESLLRIDLSEILRAILKAWEHEKLLKAPQVTDLMKVTVRNLMVTIS